MLHPLFLKTTNVHFLIVGGGYAAQEQLACLIRSCPEVTVTIVSPLFREELKLLASDKRNVELVKAIYDPKYLKGKQVVFTATDNPEVNRQVFVYCKAIDKLVSVLYESSSYSDFHSAKLAAKNDIKIAISTKGKYPDTSERLCKFFKELLPDEID